VPVFTIIVVLAARTAAAHAARTPRAAEQRAIKQ
jgi:hypothetical protein